MHSVFGEHSLRQTYLDWRLNQSSSENAFSDLVKTQNKEPELWQILSQLPPQVALKIGKQLVSEQPSWAQKVVNLQVRHILSRAREYHDKLEIEPIIVSLKALTLDFTIEWVFQSVLDALASYSTQLTNCSAHNHAEIREEVSELNYITNFNSYACVIPNTLSLTNAKNSTISTLSRDRIIENIAASSRESEDCQDGFLDTLICELLPLAESFLKKLEEQTENYHVYANKFVNTLRYMTSNSQRYGWKCDRQIKSLISNYDSKCTRPVKRRKLADVLNDRLKKDRDSVKLNDKKSHHSPTTSIAKSYQNDSKIQTLLVSPKQNDSLNVIMKKTRVHHRLMLCESSLEMARFKEHLLLKSVRNKSWQHYSLLRNKVGERFNRKLANDCYSDIYSLGLLGYSYTRFWNQGNINDTVQAYNKQHLFSFLKILRLFSIERKCVFIRFAFQQRIKRMNYSSVSTDTQDSSDICLLNEELTTTFNKITSSNPDKEQSIDERFINTLLDYSLFSPQQLFSKLLRVVIKNKGYTDFVSAIFRNLEGLESLRIDVNSPSLLVMEIKSILEEGAVDQLSENEQRNAITFLIEALKIKPDKQTPIFENSCLLDIAEYISYCAVPILKTVTVFKDNVLLKIHLETVARVLEFKVSGDNVLWWLTRTKSLSLVSILCRLYNSRSLFSSVQYIQNIKQSLNLLIDSISQSIDSLQNSIKSYRSSAQKLYSITSKLDWTTQLLLNPFFRVLSRHDYITLAPLPLPSTLEVISKRTPTFEQFYFLDCPDWDCVEITTTKSNTHQYKKRLLFLFTILEACRISDDWLLYFVKQLYPDSMESDEKVISKSILLGMVYILSSSTLEEYQRLCYLLPQQLILENDLIPEKLLQSIAPLVQNISPQGLSNLAIIAWNMDIVYWANRVTTRVRFTYSNYNFLSITLKNMIVPFLQHSDFLLCTMVLLCQGLKFIPIEYESEPIFILITQIMENFTNLTELVLSQEQKDYLNAAISLIPHDSQKQVLKLKITTFFK
ncbi:hypothetical protein K7432_001159 [Basidiobolus ranarum]|uniref:Uncharacterized protein n=1 Tax=Basidiobolus ranarum TaxID=34480 RepID=A0ABR2WA30_9FUNG